MRISELIKNLNYMKDTYGNLEVDFIFDTNKENEINVSKLYFSTDMEKIYILNSPF